MACEDSLPQKVVYSILTLYTVLSVIGKRLPVPSIEQRFVKEAFLRTHHVDDGSFLPDDSDSWDFSNKYY